MRIGPSHRPGASARGRACNQRARRGRWARAAGSLPTQLYAARRGSGPGAKKHAPVGLADVNKECAAGRGSGSGAAMERIMTRYASRVRIFYCPTRLVEPQALVVSTRVCHWCDCPDKGRAMTWILGCLCATGQLEHDCFTARGQHRPAAQPWPRGSNTQLQPPRGRAAQRSLTTWAGRDQGAAKSGYRLQELVQLLCCELFKA